MPKADGTETAALKTGRGSIRVPSTTDRLETPMLTLIAREALIASDAALRQPLPKEARSTHAAASRHHRAEPPGVMLRVLIQSKLGLGPTDHRSRRPRANPDPMPGKRARSHNHTHHV